MEMPHLPTENEVANEFGEITKRISKKRLCAYTHMCIHGEFDTHILCTAVSPGHTLPLTFLKIRS